MSNIGFKGVDCRQTGTALLFDAFLQTSSGGLVAAGTTSLFLWELQSDGSIKTYDFNDNTFKTTAVTTESVAMTYRKTNNSGTDTGYWTYVLSTLTGLTLGAIYLFRVSNASAAADQLRKFQYGSAEGDLKVTAGATGVASLWADFQLQVGLTVPIGAVTGFLEVDVEAVTDVLAVPVSVVPATLVSTGMDAVVVESGLNARQALSIAAAAVAGVLSGAAGNTVTIQAAGQPTIRITADTDSSGNRTVVALSPPA